MKPCRIDFSRRRAYARRERRATGRIRQWRCDIFDWWKCWIDRARREQGISTGVVRNAGRVWMVRELGVPGLVGAVGDLLAEAGFFETDFSFFDFGGQATSLEMLLGLFDRSLSTLHINIFGLLGDLGHDGHFGRRDFGIAPEDRHVVGLISDAIAKLANAQRRKEMTVSRQHTE